MSRPEREALGPSLLARTRIMVRRATSAVANVRAAGHTSGVKQVLRIGLASAFLLALLVASGCSATSRCPPGAPCPASAAQADVRPDRQRACCPAREGRGGTPYPGAAGPACAYQRLSHPAQQPEDHCAMAGYLLRAFRLQPEGPPVRPEPDPGSHPPGTDRRPARVHTAVAYPAASPRASSPDVRLVQSPAEPGGRGTHRLAGTGLRQRWSPRPAVTGRGRRGLPGQVGAAVAGYSAR